MSFGFSQFLHLEPPFEKTTSMKPLLSKGKLINPWNYWHLGKPNMKVDWKWFFFLNIGRFLGSILIFQGVSESNVVMAIWCMIWCIYQEYKWIKTLQLTKCIPWVATIDNPYEAQATHIQWAICQSPTT